MDDVGDDELLLERMTWEEVRTALDLDALLVVPVGSIEQHGPHMPLGADALVAHELARRVARPRHALVAPAMFYGARSTPRSGGGGRSFTGSTGLTGRTLTDAVRDVTGEFLRGGFRRIAYLNGHYENSPFVFEALTDVVDSFGDACKAILVNWWEQIVDQDLGAIFPGGFPGWEAEHAGVAETSLMEELRPELVRTDRKGDGGAARSPSYDIFPPPPEVIPATGVPWRSSPASPEIGRYLAGVLVERIGAILDREFPPAVTPRT